MIFNLTVLGHPPSVNHIWKKGRSPSGKPITYKTKEYTDWEKRVANACLIQASANKGLGFWKQQKNKYYELEINVQAPTWTTKKNTPMKPDITNLIKAAEDAVCKAFDWEDSYCTKCTIIKSSGPQLIKCTTIRFHFETSCDKNCHQTS